MGLRCQREDLHRVHEDARVDGIAERFSTPTQLADLNDIFRKVNQKSIEHQLAMFWAALLKYQPDTTFDHAIELVDELGGVWALHAMFETLDPSLRADPEDAKELSGNEEANPTPAQTQTETDSIGENSPLEPVLSA